MSLGFDCSPAAALKSLNMRIEALPFDWVVSNLHILVNCIEDDFKNFHNNLYLNKRETRLIDSYGFQFPHDYPFNINDIIISEMGEGIFEEQFDKQIVHNWNDYHSIVLEKYKRRVERFYKYLNSDDPIIFLCRGYKVSHVIQFSLYLENKFKKKYIYFVISSNENFKNNNIITCNTEKDGKWNDISIWLQSINELKNCNNL
jgi:hypothetical protein